MPPRADNIIKIWKIFFKLYLKSAQKIYPASYSLLSYYQSNIVKSQSGQIQLLSIKMYLIK